MFKFEDLFGAPNEFLLVFVEVLAFDACVDSLQSNDEDFIP